jgi:hypothetical protein
MAEKQPKTNRPVILLGSLLILFLLAFPFLLILLIMYPNSVQLKIIIPIFFLLVVSLVIMVSSLSVFQPDYSMFGRRKRTPLPDETPIYKRCARWGKTGGFLMSIPYVVWTLYPSGLGIKMPIIGEVFIPVENIVELKKEAYLPFWPPYQLIHNSIELTNPIILPDQKLFSLLDAMIRTSNRN